LFGSDPSSGPQLSHIPPDFRPVPLKQHREQERITNRAAPAAPPSLLFLAQKGGAGSNQQDARFMPCGTAHALIQSLAMPTPNRRTAMKVQGGRALRKNNWRLDRGDYFAVPQAEIRIDRRDPGRGYRHLVTVPQLRAFVALLPDWEDAAIGLRAIVLDSGEDNLMGWHQRGIVAVCAWEQRLWWTDPDPAFVADHRTLLDLIGVEHETLGKRLEVRWTADQARAFQLLHILTHELGHHHDRISTRNQREAARGEDYAERYANRVMDEVWPSYARTFGL
jgi:hypothetical protein